MIFFRDYYYYNANINWPDSSVYFWGPYDAQIQGIGVAAENNTQHQLPIATTLVGVEIRCQVNGTLATTETSTLDLYINSGATIETLGTIQMNAEYNSFSDHTLAVSLAKTDTWSIRCTNPAWATNPTNMLGMTVRLYFDTEADDNLYLKVFRTGAAFSPPSRSSYYFNGSGHTTYQTTEQFFWESPYNGIIRHASLCCRGAGASADPMTTQIYINGGGTTIDNTHRASAGSNRVMVNDIDLSFNAGDTITVAKLMPNSWSSGTPSNIIMVHDLIIEKTSN